MAEPFTIEWWNERILEESLRCPEGHGGLCQVIPPTFAEYMQGINIDPVRNVHAAIAYIQHVYGDTDA